MLFLSAKSPLESTQSFGIRVGTAQIETIAAARAEVQDLTSQVELQQRNFLRVSELMRQNATSNERYDEAELGVRSSQARLLVMGSHGELSRDTSAENTDEEEHSQAHFEQTVEVAHEALIASWSRLKGWLNEDRQFLLWRQRLNIHFAEWERTAKDSGTLLRGTPLDEAAERALRDTLAVTAEGGPS